MKETIVKFLRTAQSHTINLIKHLRERRCAPFLFNLPSYHTPLCQERPTPIYWIRGIDSLNYLNIMKVDRQVIYVSYGRLKIYSDAKEITVENVVDEVS